MLSHGRILSALSENVYHIFCSTKSTLELWEALKQKYGSEKLSFKRYSVEKCLDFHMIDDKSVF